MPEKSFDDIRNRVFTLKREESAALELYLADCAASGQALTRGEAIRAILRDWLRQKGYLDRPADDAL